jgi:alkylated DNA repair dioxygenase AlkB
MEIDMYQHIKGVDVDMAGWNYLERLKDQVPWQTVTWGRTGRKLPRMIYRYSPGDKIEVLDEIVKVCESIYEGQKVSGIFCNYYRDGNDWCPYHKDTYGTDVATFSFGGARRFLCKDDTSGKVEEFILEDGDVFFFDIEYNACHTHSIAKTKKKVDERVSVVCFLRMEGDDSEEEGDVPNDYEFALVKEAIYRFFILGSQF